MKRDYKNYKDYEPALRIKIFKNILRSFWPIIVIATLILIYFYKIIFLNKIYLIGDLYYYYSIRVLISNSLKSLTFPFWTPYLNCGFPLMSNPEAGVFDPLNLLLLYLFKPHVAFNLLICLYFFMAGVFTFFFCRSMGLDKMSSLFSALVFIFGGAFSARLVHIPMIFSAAFLPLTFTVINLYFRHRQIKHIFLIGISMGMSFLPGHPQIAIYGIFASAIYFAFRAFTDIGENHGIKKLIQYISLNIIIFAIAFGIAAIQVLPTAEFTQLSTRSSRISFQNARTISFYFQHLITYIFPYFFGKDPIVAGTTTYWGKGSFWELFIYIGILPLCFLFASFSRIRNDKRVMPFALLFVISLLLALGKNSPIFFLAYHAILPFQYFSNPCRFIFILSFTSAVLAGLGLSFVSIDERLLKRMLHILIICSLILLAVVISFNCILYLGNISSKFIKGFDIRNIHNQLTVILFVATIVLLFLKKNRKLKIKVFNFVVITIAFIDLLIVSSSHNVPVDADIVASSPKSISFLKKDKDIFRTYNIGVDFPYGSQKHAELWKIPFFAPWGIESANLAGPLYLKSYFFLRGIDERILYDKSFLIDEYLDTLSLFNVKYITSPINLKSNVLQFLFDDGTVKIYKNPRSYPRVFFINAQEFRNDPDGLKRKLFEGISTLKEFLEMNKETLSESESNLSSYAPSIDITKHSNDSVVIKVNTPIAGLLVLSETAYPGWKAFVDKKEEKILIINYAMRAIFLNKGEHFVKFIYSPESVKLGFLITFSFCLVSAIFLFSPIGLKKI